jgi:hypothetical protein
MQQADIPTLDASAFEDEEAFDRHRRNVVRNAMIKAAGNEIAAFSAINLNGSGRICSQEFADGVARLGVKWQLLTGLSKPRDLFRLFDMCPKNGVISLFELFPSEYNKPKDDSGATTPDFWKKWVHSNHDLTDQAPRGPRWAPAGPEEALGRLFEAREKNDNSALKHKWMSKTFRRMKARGKTDARCREMVALHLPRGSGPADRQDVKTFSQAEVKFVKRTYQDAVLEPQRKILKDLYSLREHRKTLTTSRQKLFAVSMEPYLRQKAKEDAKKFANAFGEGGLHLGLHKKTESEADKEEYQHDHHHEGKEDVKDHRDESFQEDDGATEQLSFDQLAKKTGMDVFLIEDVFRVWMRHVDKSECIPRRVFPRLLEELCSGRTFPESDLTAWWDMVHGRNDVAKTSIDWQATDPENIEAEAPSSVGTVGADGLPRGLKEVRRAPATFDQFLLWYSTSEVRTV